MVAASSIPCRFYARGHCRNGEYCAFLHDDSPSVSTDPRSAIQCRYMSRPGGCRYTLCPYNHVRNHSMFGNEDVDEKEDGESDPTRCISGATVQFDEFGHVRDVAFPTDYSCATITGLAPRSTPGAVVKILEGLGFNIAVECVRVLKDDDPDTPTTANIKVKDPSLARALCNSLDAQEGSSLRASIAAVDPEQAISRKLRISWHKAVRTVWLNFGSAEIGRSVCKKFESGAYKCLGHRIQCSGPWTEFQEVNRKSYNPNAYTVILSDVPGHATYADVERCIILSMDQPRHIEMGSLCTHDAHDSEVKDAVQKALEAHGPLESFSLAHTPGKRRGKATAIFRDEIDANSASSSLNNSVLEVLHKGRITVELVQSAKVKITHGVYGALKATIDERVQVWKDDHLSFRAYIHPTQPFVTLKIEGGQARVFADACRTLHDITSGIVLKSGGQTLWHPALSGNGTTYKRILAIAETLEVVINRDKSERQLKYYGPADKMHEAINHISRVCSARNFDEYQIDLDRHLQQSTWGTRARIGTVENELGDHAVVVDELLRSVVIRGTVEDYFRALDILEGRFNRPDDDLDDRLDLSDCPICFDPAYNPITLSCSHSYCLDCFERHCQAAASNSSGAFRVGCYGADGECPAIFKLKELKGHLTSRAFEQLLQSSFKEYVKRRPGQFRYCPQPDCDSVYRSPDPNKPSTGSYTCRKCFERLCTPCNAEHSGDTCEEYQDKVTRGREALTSVKAQLDIRDCPRCQTPIEKRDGCNHMQCAGCSIHICWRCMALFEEKRPCYDHLVKEHGGWAGDQNAPEGDDADDEDDDEVEGDDEVEYDDEVEDDDDVEGDDEVEDDDEVKDDDEVEDLIDLEDFDAIAHFQTLINNNYQIGNQMDFDHTDDHIDA